MGRKSAGKKRKHKHRPPPEAVDTHAKRSALRTIAVYEAVKGGLVLAGGIGLLTLLHKDYSEVAEQLIRFFHIDPEGHASESILRAASQMTDPKLIAVAAGTVIYAAVRFIEAYGLWFARVWAEYFAMLSGMLYLPWEIYEIARKSTPLRWALLATNLLIVGYMAYNRLRACRPIEDEEAPEAVSP